MPETQYYSGKKLVVTSVKITYGGSTYPISAVTGVHVTKLPESETESNEYTMGRGVGLAIVGVLLFVWGAINLFGGGDIWGAAGILLLFGTGGTVGGGWFVRKGWIADRKMSAKRQVHVRLASGDSLVVRTSSAARAKEIRIALDRAITTRETAGNTASVADELGKLASLRGEGILSKDDWERAKDLYLGKQPDEQAAAIVQLKKLHDLHRQNVLSESEFNSKKWDILSRTT